MYSSSITSISSDKTSYKKGDTAYITYTVNDNNKYKLKFQAYDPNNNIISPNNFSAVEFGKTAFVIPNNYKYGYVKVKLVLEDNIDNTIKDKKEIYLQIKNNQVNSPSDCPQWATYYNHRCWAWASPCSGGCSTITFSHVASGWRFVKSESEWNLRPDKSMIQHCAAPYFDNKWTHCDSGNTPVWKYDGSYNELWVVCDKNCKTNTVADTLQYPDYWSCCHFK
ncbi:hypothetical protein [Caminibacter sp.]